MRPRACPPPRRLAKVFLPTDLRLRTQFIRIVVESGFQAKVIPFKQMEVHVCKQ